MRTCLDDNESRAFTMISVSEMIGKLPYIDWLFPDMYNSAENITFLPDKIIPAARFLALKGHGLTYMLSSDTNACIAIRDSNDGDYSSCSAGEIQAGVIFEHDGYSELLLCMEPHKYPAGNDVYDHLVQKNTAYQKTISDVIDFSKSASAYPYAVRLVRDDLNSTFRSSAAEMRWKYNMYSRGPEIPKDLDYFEVKRFKKTHDLPKKARLFDSMALYSEDIECPYWMPIEEYLESIKTSNPRMKTR